MLCQVTVKVFNRGEPREVWFVLETEHETLADVFAQLREAGAIYGNRLETRPIGGGRREVIDRAEAIVGAQSIVQISEVQTEIVNRSGIRIAGPNADQARRAAS